MQCNHGMIVLACFKLLYTINLDAVIKEMYLKCILEIILKRRKKVNPQFANRNFKNIICQI